MEIYTTKLWFTKLSPPFLEGYLPKLGRVKLLERLAKYRIDEAKLETFKTEDGYYVPIANEVFLEVIRRL